MPSSKQRVAENVCFLCAEPATEKCPACDLAFFCSENHAKLHRPENLCFPFKIKYDPLVGRYMVATRDIEPLGKVV